MTTHASIDVDASVALLKALANPARLRIALRLLDGEKAVNELETELGIRQPMLSQHLAELREAGLVTTRRQSRIIFYRLAGENPKRPISTLLLGLSGVVPTGTSLIERVTPRRTKQAARFAVVWPSR